MEFTADIVWYLELLDSTFGENEYVCIICSPLNIFTSIHVIGKMRCVGTGAVQTVQIQSCFKMFSNLFCACKYFKYLTDEFLLKSVVFKFILKGISRAEHEYINIYPPPPPN